MQECNAGCSWFLTKGTLLLPFTSYLNRTYSREASLSRRTLYSRCYVSLSRNYTSFVCCSVLSSRIAFSITFLVTQRYHFSDIVSLYQRKVKFLIHFFKRQEIEKLLFWHGNATVLICFCYLFLLVSSKFSPIVHKK